MRDGQRPAREAQRTARVAVPLVVPAKIRVPSPDALPRERLEARLHDAWRHRLTLVVAPAGSGKTTLVARFAAQAGASRSGWYRAETWDADEASFVRHLEAALRSALPGAARRLDERRGRRARPSRRGPCPAAGPAHRRRPLRSRARDAEAALGRLVDYAPPWLALIVATRVAPSINLPRLRVADELLELGTDDLRFRAWEVEQLFRDVYHDPVLPADLAVLARRTEGWAAGLQLFHLATRGRSAEERRRVLGGAEIERPAAARVPRPERDGRAARGAPRVPASTPACWAGCPGRCAIALRGADGQRRAPRRAGAARACSRSRWRTARRRVPLPRGPAPAPRPDAGRGDRRGRGPRRATRRPGPSSRTRARSPRRCGPTAAPRTGTRSGGCSAGRASGSPRAEQSGWMEELPPAIERHDPWVALAAARRARNDGRWAAALDGYAHAEAAFGPSRAAEAPRAERQRARRLARPRGHADRRTRSGRCATGLVREPVLGARDAGAAGRPVGAGRARPAAPRGGRGDGGPADPRGDGRRGRGEPGGLRRRAARARRSRRAWAERRGTPGAFDRAVEEAERAGSPWLARLGRSLARAARPGAPRTATSARATRRSAAARTRGAAALLDLGRGVGRRRPIPSGAWRSADAATAEFRRLGAGVLEAWARGLAALASASLGTPDARETALGAESAGRARRVASRPACTPTRRWPTSTRCAARSTRCWPRPSASETGLVVPRA